MNVSKAPSDPNALIRRSLDETTTGLVSDSQSYRLLLCAETMQQRIGNIALGMVIRNNAYAT